MFSYIKKLLEDDSAVPMNMEARVEIAIQLTYLFYENRNHPAFLEKLRELPMFAESSGCELTDNSEWNLLLLLAYGIFQTIFHEDPFWGIDTLYRYPFVTQKVREKVYREDKKYVFHPAGINNYPDFPEYENAKLIKRFLPGYLVKMFENAFVDGMANAELMPTFEQWLWVVRRLRDDLMNSEKPPFFICWDKEGGFSPKVNYLQIKVQHTTKPDSPEEYLWAIPMKDGKKIYRYHISSGDADNTICEDEPVAVFVENGKINRFRRDLWFILDKRNALYLEKNKEKKIIDLENRYFLVWHGNDMFGERILIVAEEVSGDSIVERWRGI